MWIGPGSASMWHIDVGKDESPSNAGSPSPKQQQAAQNYETLADYLLILADWEPSRHEKRKRALSAHVLDL